MMSFGYLSYIKFAIKINCSYLLFFFNVIPRKYTIIYGVCIKFLPDPIFLQLSVLYATLEATRHHINTLLDVTALKSFRFRQRLRPKFYCS